MVGLTGHVLNVYDTRNTALRQRRQRASDDRHDLLQEDGLQVREARLGQDLYAHGENVLQVGGEGALLRGHAAVQVHDLEQDVHVVQQRGASVLR